MSYTSKQTKSESSETSASDWMQALAQYRRPDHFRSILEIILTGIPFILLWLAAWWALSISYWLTLAISVPAAGFLVRIFMIQHDCGHASFFRRKETNDWVGRVLGTLTLTPYFVWRRSHSVHHSTHGNLEKRGTGDIDTLTVREYQALSPRRRLAYRLYRHPIVMFGIGPAYIFLLQNRWPSGFMRSGWRFWLSAMGTNASIILAVSLMIYLIGAVPFLLVHLPIVVFASSIGVWLFYVQHQFEDTTWAHDEDWQLHDAALYGSSHYDLPVVLRWMTANIGVHHVHHLSSRIPYYRLQEVLRDHPELTEVKRLTLWESFACVRLQLWDEEKRKLISFSKARNLQPA